MMGHDNAGRPTSVHGRALVLLAGCAVAVVAAACTSGSGTKAEPGKSPAPDGAPSSASAPSTPAPVTSTKADPAVITATPASGAKGVSPAKPVTVAVSNGTLVSVKMTNPAGRTVSGALGAGKTSWKSTEALGYGKTYTLTARATNGDGTAVVKQSKITTLTPDNQTTPYLQRIGGYTLGQHQTYGVAVVPIVHFDEKVTDTAAAEKAMKVTTTPHVAGAWYWQPSGGGGSDAHFRPKSYWPSGTKVTIAADVYGVKLGHGLYGSNDVKSSFTVGRKQLTVAYDTAPKSVNKVRVYNAAGKVLRTMNTSMGEHTGQQVGSSFINFYTMDGTYTVLDHEQPAKMCSASYGLPANAPGGYPCENIYNATKISVDGIYLHFLNTFYAQDNGLDVSHGCLNLNEANSMWFFKHSIPGDPVVIHGNKNAPKLQLWQGGDWSVPWSTWAKGGAA